MNHNGLVCLEGSEEMHAFPRRCLGGNSLLNHHTNYRHSQKHYKLISKYFLLTSRVTPFIVNPPLSVRGKKNKTKQNKKAESQHPFSLVTRFVKTLKNSTQARNYTEDFWGCLGFFCFIIQDFNNVFIIFRQVILKDSI